MTKKTGFHKKSTPHISEFSRRAKSYGEHNIIQRKVVQKLISGIDSKPKRILDLGCGSGAVYHLIDWEIEHFTGIDKADQMCALHPENERITLLHEDFENETMLKQLGHFDIVISSSALQWASNLNRLFANIAPLTDEIAFAVFCDGTFKTIYEITGMESFLPSHEVLTRNLEKYFTFHSEVVRYQLSFTDNLSKFRYIKKSGVSGGKRKLNIEQTKKLIQTYPLDYLEFEVMFCWGKSKIT